MHESKLSKWAWGILAWLVALTIFFPIFVMIITAFKNEREAQSLSLFFIPTLVSFYQVFARSNYAVYVWNSILASIGSTLLCFALAIPAAYRMAFYPTPKTQSTLVWMLSTCWSQQVSELVLDLAGPAGLASGASADSDLTEWERVAGPLFLNLRKASIYGGSNEVQRQIISRNILGPLSERSTWTSCTTTSRTRCARP